MVHHNLGDSQRTPSPSRGQVFKSNKHTEIIDEVLSLKIERVTQKDDSNLSYEAWIGVKLEGERV
jgi:hypothetical protein